MLAATSDSRPAVLTLTDRYLPGFKAGGPIRSLANLVEHLGDEFQFRIITRDRDGGDTQPYAGITINQWQPVGKADVFYLSSPHRLGGLLRSETNNSASPVLYLNSFFSAAFTIQTLLLRKLRVIDSANVIIAPRGELSDGALGLKAWKKRPYLFASRLLHLYDDVIWHASTLHEERELRRWAGRGATILIAQNLLAQTMHGLSFQRSTKQAGELRVAFISRISRKKNLASALRLLAQLPGRVHFNIYGPIEDSAYWHECKNIGSKLPLNIRVNYCDCLPYDKVSDVLSQHHLFFLPTLGENFGHVIIEALQAGCPVLISDRTPWRNLEKSRAGWDLPLDRPDLFLGALRFCTEMGETEFTRWSEGAQTFGARALGTDAISENRTLFRTALEVARSPDEATNVTLKDPFLN